MNRFNVNNRDMSHYINPDAPITKGSDNLED